VSALPRPTEFHHADKIEHDEVVGTGGELDSSSIGSPPVPGHPPPAGRSAEHRAAWNLGTTEVSGKSQGDRVRTPDAPQGA
jgi:hypothetical protein